MEIDIPEVKAEVEAAFAEYERALVQIDVPVLDRLFWNHAKVVRYGAAEIAAFRAARPSHGLARTLERTQITTFGRDFAVASTLFRRGPGKIGRQQQSWVRFPEGWRVVAAHVSVIDDPGG